MLIEGMPESESACGGGGGYLVMGWDLVLGPGVPGIWGVYVLLGAGVPGVRGV